MGERVGFVLSCSQESCSEALRQGHVHYAPAAGIPQLRSALAERASQARLGKGNAGRHLIPKRREEYESAVDPDSVVVCNGGMEAASRLSQL